MEGIVNAAFIAVSNIDVQAVFTITRGNANRVTLGPNIYMQTGHRVRRRSMEDGAYVNGGLIPGRDGDRATYVFDADNAYGGRGHGLVKLRAIPVEVEMSVASRTQCCHG